MGSCQKFAFSESSNRSEKHCTKLQCHCYLLTWSVHTLKNTLLAYALEHQSYSAWATVTHLFNAILMSHQTLSIACQPASMPTYCYAQMKFFQYLHQLVATQDHGADISQAKQLRHWNQTIEYSQSHC